LKNRDGLFCLRGWNCGSEEYEVAKSAVQRYMQKWLATSDWGFTSLTQPAPEGEGAARCIQMAPGTAGIEPKGQFHKCMVLRLFNDLYETK
jgi:hypothetical protein